MRSYFVPMLAGATFRDRLLACMGAACGIAITAGLAALFVIDVNDALLMAPVGASAVLIFAVPASPLAQPWSVIGGNFVSALVGVSVATLVSAPSIACGLAVGLAILLMSLLRCLHPPGGAVALTAVIGGPAITNSGWMFPLEPVTVNSVILVVAGIVYHQFSHHSYPHRTASVLTSPARPAEDRVPHPEDLDNALADLGETFDISRDDLDLLFARVKEHAAARQLVQAKRPDR